MARKVANGIVIKSESERCHSHSGVEAHMQNFTAWQKAQDGTLQEVCKKVDALKYWILGALLGIVVASGIFNYIW